MDIRQPTTMTEERSLFGMVQYFMNMWPRRSHVLATMIEASIIPKDRGILCNNNMEVYFRQIKRIVSTESLLDYTYWKIPFTVPKDTSNTHMGAVISQNDKPVASFLR